MVARASAVGVLGIVVPGVRASGWARLRDLAATYGWWWGVGTHPWAVATEPVIPRDPAGAHAIGECGLDGGVGDLDAQAAVLDGHLRLARETGLPVLLHCVRAHHLLPRLLRPYAPVRGVLHSYSGGPDLVDTYVRLGLHLSFAGAVTRPNARRPVEAARRVPRDRLLVETDAPDQAPFGEPARSEPSLLPRIVRRLEEIRGEPLGEVLVTNAAALGWSAPEPR